MSWVGRFTKDLCLSVVAFFMVLTWLLFGRLIERITKKPFGWQ